MTRARAAVHAEVVRALRRLTALPLSGELIQGARKPTNSSRNAATVACNSNGNVLGLKPAQGGSGSRAVIGSPLAHRGTDGAAAQAHSTDATSPRKGRRLQLHDARSEGSKAVGDEAAQTSEATASAQRKGGNDGCTAAVVFMDKISARAHADAITSHTYKAFQRVRSCSCRIICFKGP